MSEQRAIVPTPDYSYVEIDSVRAGSTNDNKTVTPYTTSISVHNHMTDAISVAGRDGIPIRIRRSGSRANTVEIVKTIIVSNDCSIDPENIYITQGLNVKEREAYTKAIEFAETSGTYRGRKIQVTYTLKREELVRVEGGFYLAELDLTLSVQPEDVVNPGAIHPASCVATRYKLFDSMICVNHPNQFGFGMYIISNDQRYGDRYINVQGDVYRIPSIINNSLRNGVYVCRSSPIYGNEKAGIPKETYYEYSEADDQLDIYLSPEDARLHGNSKEQFQRDMKRQEEELKLELFNAKKELQKTEHEHAKYLAEIETAKARRDQINKELDEMREREKQERKDYYDERNQHRKDQSDLVKYIPAMITGGFAVLTLVMKLRND